MQKALVYGKEHTFLEPATGLLFRNSSLSETASLHTHTFYEFFLVSDGTALHHINHSIQTLQKGDLVFIRPKDTHTYEFYCSDNFRIINVGFSIEIFQDIQIFLDHSPLLQSLVNAELPPCITVDSNSLEKIRTNLLEIGSLMKSSNILLTAFTAKCYLAELFIQHFISFTEQMDNPNCPSWFSNMLREMQKIDNLQLGYDKMLALSPCSPNHLCRLFRNIMSTTPTDYLNSKRLEYTVYLLTQTNMDIMEIGLSCGFTSLSHFYHLFKKKYGIAPYKFRKSHTLYH